MAPVKSWKFWGMSLAIFALGLAWDTIGVLGTRCYAGQALCSLPISAILTAFSAVGITACADKRLIPALVLGAVAGTWIGISL